MQKYEVEPTLDETQSVEIPVPIAGAGVPKGGKLGQVLTKKSDKPFDVEWKNIEDEVGIDEETAKKLIAEETSNLQPKYDESLPTENKEIVGAIKELYEREDKQGLSREQVEGIVDDKTDAISQDIAVINIALEQSGLLKKYKQPITQEYNERVTADGLNVLDGSKAVLKKVVGSTVACKNLFNQSLIEEKTEVVDGARIIAVDERTVTIKTGVNYPASQNGYTATDRLLSELCPALKVGDVVYIDFDTNATTGNALNACYVSGLGVWRKGEAKTITEESLNSVFAFYADITPNFETVISNFCITKEQNTPYQPYFTGLKSASFAGIESTNADGTETSTLAFPKTATPLGVTIDFEQKKIIDSAVDIVLTGEENWGYYNGLSSNGVSLGSVGKPVATNATGVCTDAEVLPYNEANAIRFMVGGLFWFGVLDYLGFTTAGTTPTEEEKSAAVAKFKAWLSQRYAEGNPVTIRAMSSTATETDFTADNEYTAWHKGMERVENDGAQFGVDNTLTQDYILVTEVG